MARTATPERRVSGAGARLGMFSRGGGCGFDDNARAALSSIVHCSTCVAGWASLLTLGYERGRLTASYLCNQCGHVERRAAVRVIERCAGIDVGKTFLTVCREFSVNVRRAI